MSKNKILKNQTVIITGASRGIGRAIALRLAKDGANIAFNYQKNFQKAQELEIELGKIGVKAKGYQVDIRDFDAVGNMRKSIQEDFGSIDVLINNAGITKDAALMMMNKDQWQDVIDTNLTGVFNMSKACIVTFMKQKKGNIVNMTSISGIMGMPRQVNYSASKGGIIAMTRSLAKEVAPYGIRVNAVAPGFIETDMISELTDEYLENAKEAIPLKRFGTADEVAGVVHFLLSESAQYITGQVIQIDGGMGIK